MIAITSNFYRIFQFVQSVRKDSSREYTTIGDVESSITSNAAVIRKTKEQTLIERYRFSHTNPVLNLLQSSKQGKYYVTIHNIELLEFFCIYWSLEQLLYRSRSKKNPTVFMTIDATGDVIKRNCEPFVFYIPVYVCK